MKRIDDKIFSIISHDLKSPFNSLIGFTKLLKDNYDKYDDIKKKQIIDILYKTSLDAHRLSENLVLWRHAETDQLNFRPESVVLVDFVNTSIQNLAKHLEKKNITITNEIPDSTIVEADKEMLSSILSNLLSNAVKYTSKNGVVVIKSEKKSSFVEIQIHDNGVGVPKEIQENLFTISKDVIRIGTDNEKGSGLGLAITKALVEKQGGKVWINEALSQGACFAFTLPEAIVESKEKTIPNRSKTSEKPTILITEDDETNYFLLETLLNDFNLDLDVIHVVNGKEAVTAANEIPDISLILMDMKMPIMDGYEATRLIKQKHPNMPIIAQTAYTSREERERAMVAGCDDIIAKPIDVKELHAIIMKLLK